MAKKQSGYVVYQKLKAKDKSFPFSEDEFYTFISQNANNEDVLNGMFEKLKQADPTVGFDFTYFKDRIKSDYASEKALFEVPETVNPTVPIPKPLPTPYINEAQKLGVEEKPIAVSTAPQPIAPEKPWELGKQNQEAVKFNRSLEKINSEAASQEIPVLDYLNTKEPEIAENFLDEQYKLHYDNMAKVNVIEKQLEELSKDPYADPKEIEQLKQDIDTYSFTFKNTLRAGRLLKGKGGFVEFFGDEQAKKDYIDLKKESNDISTKMNFPAGLSSKEKFKLYYNTLYDRWKELDKEVKDSSVELLGQKFSIGQKGLADEYNSIESKLRKYAPIVLLNINPFDLDDENYATDILKRAGQGLAPNLMGEALKTEEQQIKEFIPVMEQTDIQVTPEVQKELEYAYDFEKKQQKDTSSLSNPYTWTSVAGNSLALGVQLALGGAVTRGALMATSPGLLSVADAGIEGASLLSSNAARTIGARLLVGGLEYETAGQLFDQEEELYFGAGLTGTAGRELLSTVLPKSVAPVMNKILGDKYDDFANATKEYGKFVLSRAGTGLAEGGEEYSQALHDILKDSNYDLNVFSDKVKEQLGTLEQSSKILIPSFVMGAMLGQATETGKLLTQNIREDYEQLPAEEKQKFDQVTKVIADEIKQGTQEAAKETVSQVKTEGEGFQKDNDVELNNFVNRIRTGEKMDSPEDLQFYDNNKSQIESKLKEDAVQVETAGEVPVQPETISSEENAQGQPEAEPQIHAQEKKIRRNASNIANQIRSYKIHKDKKQAYSVTPQSLLIDTALEAGAKTIEIGGNIAQAVEDAINYVKNSDWYKTANDKQRQRVEKDVMARIETAIPEYKNSRAEVSQFFENLNKTKQRSKEIKGSFSTFLKNEKDNIRKLTGVRNSQVVRLVNNINDNNFADTVSKIESIIGDNQVAVTKREAVNLYDKINKKAKLKDVPLNQREISKRLTNIDLSFVDDIEEHLRFLDEMDNIMSKIKETEFIVEPRDITPLSEVVDYVKRMEETQKRKAFEYEMSQSLTNENLNYDELQKLYERLDNVSEEMFDDQSNEIIKEELKGKKKEAFDEWFEYSKKQLEKAKEGFDKPQKEAISQLQKINTNSLTPRQRVNFARTVENIVYHNSLDGAGKWDEYSFTDNKMDEFITEAEAKGIKSKKTTKLTTLIDTLPAAAQAIILDDELSAKLRFITGESLIYDAEASLSKDRKKFLQSLKDIRGKMKEDHSDPVNTFKLAFYSALNQYNPVKNETIDEQFMNTKLLIQDSIDKYKNSTNDTFKKLYPKLQKAWDDMGIENAEDINDLNVSDEVKELNQFVVNDWSGNVKEKLYENDRYYRNEDQSQPFVENYIPRATKMMVYTKENEENVIEENRLGTVNSLKTKRFGGLEFERTAQTQYSDPQQVLDFDFWNAYLRKRDQAMRDAKIIKGLTRLNSFMQNPKSNKIFPSAQTKQRYLDKVQRFLMKEYIAPDGALEESVMWATNWLGSVAAVQTLGGLSQIVVQASALGSVLTEIATKDPSRVKSLLSIPSEFFSSKLFQETVLAERGETSVIFSPFDDPNKSVALKSEFGRLLNKIPILSGKEGRYIRDKLMAPMLKGDKAIYTIGYYHFYDMKMKELGFDKYSFDEINEEAASYAQTRMETLMGPSMAKAGGELVNPEGFWLKAGRNMIMPFAGFPVSQMARKTNSIKKILNNTNKAEATRDLIGVFAESALYNSLKALVGMGIYTGVISLMDAAGYDDSDTEKKVKTKEGKKEKTLEERAFEEKDLIKDIYTDAIFTGMPLDGPSKYAANKLTYWGLNNLDQIEEGTDPSEWERFNAPFSRFGGKDIFNMNSLYGIPAKNLVKMYDNAMILYSDAHAVSDDYRDYEVKPSDEMRNAAIINLMVTVPGTFFGVPAELRKMADKTFDEALNAEKNKGNAKAKKKVSFWDKKIGE